MSTFQWWKRIRFPFPFSSSACAHFIEVKMAHFQSEKTHVACVGFLWVAVRCVKSELYITLLDCCCFCCFCCCCCCCCGLRRRPPLCCRCVRCCGCCGGNPLSACQSLPGVQADDSESDGDLAFATMSHHTSRKVNMGPEHGGLEDGVPFKMWFLGSMLIFQGVFAFRGMNASGTDILCVRATLKLPFVNPGPLSFFGRMYVCTCDVTTVYYII